MKRTKIFALSALLVAASAIAGLAYASTPPVVPSHSRVPFTKPNVTIPHRAGEQQILTCPGTAPMPVQVGVGDWQFVPNVYPFTAAMVSSGDLACGYANSPGTNDWEHIAGWYFKPIDPDLKDCQAAPDHKSVICHW